MVEIRACKAKNIYLFYDTKKEMFIYGPIKSPYEKQNINTGQLLPNAECVHHGD